MNKYDVQEKRLERLFSVLSSVADALGETFGLVPEWDEDSDLDVPAFFYSGFTVRCIDHVMDEFLLECENVSLKNTGVEATALLLIKLA